MRLIYIATTGGVFSIPIYVMAFYRSPASIALAFLIWAWLLMFFWNFYDDEGNFCG